MTLNLCLESYGAAVHVMDTLIAASAEQTRRPVRQARRLWGQSRSVDTQAKVVVEDGFPGPDPVAPGLPSIESADPTFDDHVRDGAARIPFDQAHALWLVDVCGCSYEQAAGEAFTSREAIAERVAAGRKFIRVGLIAEPVTFPVG